MDTTARFRLSEAGELIRARRTVRKFRRRGDLNKDRERQLERQCVADPAETNTFAIDDDGVSADVRISDTLRKLGRESRRLYLRARGRPERLRAFVAHSFELRDTLEQEIASASPIDPDAGAYGISMRGASADAIEGGIRIDLNWANISRATKVQNRPLLRALQNIRSGGLGAWIDQINDYGGCHRPELAQPALRALAAAWNQAEPGLKDLFRSFLSNELRQMTEDLCFCNPRGQRRQIQGALDANAVILEGVDADVARALRAALSKKTVRFECHGPG